MTPPKKQTMEDYVDFESKMQKWRKLTPIGMILNLIATFGSMGVVGWFAIHLVTTFERELDSINKKIDTGNALVIQRIDDYVQKENNDVLSLTQKQSADFLALNQKVYACCARINN